MKQTALEFFIEQLDCLNRERKENLIDAETFFKHKKILTQQAKAMEKKQKEEEWLKGFDSGKGITKPEVCGCKINI
jgi:hypothetical protein